MKTLLSAAAVAAFLTGGSIMVARAADSELGAPTAYVQMNSSGDGISSGARSTGNARTRGYRYRGHRRHHRHRHHR